MSFLATRLTQRSGQRGRFVKVKTEQTRKVTEIPSLMIYKGDQESALFKQLCFGFKSRIQVRFLLIS